MPYPLPHSGPVLVTGGAGFIGSHLVLRLVADGWRVRVLDDLSRGRLENLKPVADRIEFIEGSILDPRRLDDAVRGVSVIFHEAALASVPHSVERPLEYHSVNATGTLLVLEAARVAGVGRLIYAASSSAYGDTPASPKREDQAPRPLSPYAAGKLAGEHYVAAYAALHGIKTLSLRYFNVFGPRQDPASQYGAAIPAIVGRLLDDQPPTIHGDGEQSRDFCYIDNVVEANLLAAGCANATGQAVNIACGVGTTVNEVARLAASLLGKPIAPVHGPPRIGDVRHSLADIALAERLLGYRPRVHFAEGLKRTIDWMLGARAAA